MGTPLTPATLLLTLDILGTFVSAMSGAAVVFGTLLHLPGAMVAPAGATRCFLMRLLAIRRRVNLLVASDSPPERPSEPVPR